jgi:hypothetical protein
MVFAKCENTGREKTTMADGKQAAAGQEAHDFIALHDNEVAWQSGPGVNELLALPDGVEVKIFAYDPVMKRVDMKVKFPPGYVEPAHSHKSWHSIMVLKGRMCVAGKDLRPGDYVFGWDLPHGPYEYPDGCEVFTVFMGEGTQHEWDEAVHLSHELEWDAETETGKAGVAAHAAARKSGRSSV